MGPLAPFFGFGRVAEGGICYKQEVWHGDKCEGVIAQGIMQIALKK